MCDYDIGQNLEHCTFYIWLCTMLNVSCSNECHSKIKQKVTDSYLWRRYN